VTAGAGDAAARRTRKAAASAPAAEAAPPAPPATYGTPVSLAARDALLAELARTNAAVEWLRGEVAKLTPDQLIRGTRYVRRTEKDGDVATTTEAGAARHEFLALYMEERRFLRQLVIDALDHRLDPPAPTGDSPAWPTG
jgi:hypothetical protein